MPVPRMFGIVALLSMLADHAMAEPREGPDGPEVLGAVQLPVPCDPDARTACAAAAPLAGGGTTGAGSTCREYRVPVIVGDKTVEAVGRACLEPDGVWRITQDTPGLPQQVYIVRAPYWDYPYPAWAYDPWFYGPPFWFGGAVFVGRVPHRHHRFHPGGMHRPHHSG